MTLQLNPNKSLVNSLKDAIERKGGYCPCLLFKSEDTECPFYKRKEYPNFVNIDDVCVHSQKEHNVAEDGCCCSLYIPIKKNESV